MGDTYYEKTLTLVPAGTYVADGTGTAYVTGGKQKSWVVVCDYTAKATDANDTMDVYIDVLVGTLWINVIRFTTALGNGTDAQREVGNITPANQNTAVTAVSADCASGVVRPGITGSQIRARWDFTDGGGGGAATFDFSVLAYSAV
jgi:hypothetical protein